MNHLSEEQLTEAYYDRVHWQHLSECLECRSNLDRLRTVLDGARDYPVPERGPGYGGEVWSRLLLQLPQTKRRKRWLHWWTLTPIFAALVIVVFLAGMMTQHRREAAVFAKARERVLFIALSRHLERSQIVLAQIANATPTNIDITHESERARDLLNENRLLRQTAARAGDATDAVLLDQLERVLLDIANSPTDISAADLASLQSRIDGEGLLFKVRITSSDIGFKGQKL